MKVLVIEDEPKVASFIKEGLEEQHYVVDLAYDGYTGEKLALNNNYNLIILDIIIPVINGVELCKRIKSLKPQIPILLLTALSTTDNKVSGFEAGADDYLVKPFEFKELLARIRALIRRTAIGPVIIREQLAIADLTLDMDKMVARRGTTTISLTAKEFSLLEFFMRNRGRVLSKPEISEKVWDVNFDTGTNVVEVYINILRKKIDRDFEQKLIHTRIGLGYIFTDTP
ncbi:MAG: response regulator transcription factor [Cyclobacteriaceae bacterium]|nr:response regulator transcription factor [Cyclobacteriaceae bacterium]